MIFPFDALRLDILVTLLINHNSSVINIIIVTITIMSVEEGGWLVIADSWRNLRTELDEEGEGAGGRQPVHRRPS